MNRANIRKQFPILTRKIHGKPLVYLDNASTTQKPKCVLDAITKFYSYTNANIHRGMHTLSQEATLSYEHSRDSVATFIGAHSNEIIFTKGATEGINLIANSWGTTHIKNGDEIVVSLLEHHANLVPWQELARRKGALLRIVGLTKNLEWDEKAFTEALSPRTKLVCVTAGSNVIGLMPPLKKIIKEAHGVGARVLVDAAQIVAHTSVNVRSLDCDFLVFSAHKMFGPTGVGALFVKKDIMEAMPPYQYGGDMVLQVTRQNALYQTGPARFEAGTPNIADVIAFKTSIEFLHTVGLTDIRSHEQALLAQAVQLLTSHERVKVFYAPTQNCGVISFDIDSIHPHDVATVFDSEGVAIRSGLHCAEPLIRSLGVTAVSRLSFSLYNTEADIDAVNQALKKVYKIFKPSKKQLTYTYKT